MRDIRHWYIQKPIAHNCPNEIHGAVFQEFMPTVSDQKCEWIRVYSADDIQAKIGMGMTRYSEVCAKLAIAVEALKKYTKDPEFKEFDSVMNFCSDDCPRDCEEHNSIHKVRARSVAQPKSIAIEALSKIVGGAE